MIAHSILDDPPPSASGLSPQNVVDISCTYFIRPSSTSGCGGAAPACSRHPAMTCFYQGILQIILRLQLLSKATSLTGVILSNVILQLLRILCFYVFPVFMNLTRLMVWSYGGQMFDSFLVSSKICWAGKLVEHDTLEG